MPGPLSLRARVTLWTCVAAAAASFGLLDVGRRARLDPATEEAWRARERVRTDAAAVPLPPDQPGRGGTPGRFGLGVGVRAPTKTLPTHPRAGNA